jgi:hypothetical protein
VLITAPASPHYHFTAEVDVDAAATVTFSKTPNVATSATAIIGWNNNENSLDASLLTHGYGGVYTSSGTILATYTLGSIAGNGANRSIIGGDVSGRHEIELGASSTHLLRVLPGAATCVTAIRMYYYKES